MAMAIYNCAPTLHDAINSIINQTYKDWELILCDDGSTDDTLKIAKDYEAAYDNILVIENSHNKGLPASLNHCIEYAQGDYIARMDGDDISLPRRFEAEMSIFESHPEYAIVSCAMINFDESGDWGVQRKPEYPTKISFVYDSPFCHAPCIMRKEALASVGNYTVRDDLRRGQDYYLWHKFYCHGYKGYNLQEPYYKMRDDEAAAARRGFNMSYWQRVKRSMMFYRVKKEIFKNLELPIKYRLLTFRPVLVALLPRTLYSLMHKRNIGK